MQANETGPPRTSARASRHNDSDDPPPLEKDIEFWYDDGTLILIAANVEFRVYRGPLATHSPVFRDMLALPQPLSSQSTSSAYDTSNPSSLCPTVHVTDSPSTSDTFCVPSLLEGPSSTFLSQSTHAQNWRLQPIFQLACLCRPTDALTFHAVSAWIRLGHKYEVDSLVENGLQYFRRFYPSVLSDSPYACPGPIKNDRPNDVLGSHAIAIVNLARLTGSNDLLPLAFLECCKLGAGIVNGCMREDGTVEYLHPDDLGRCFAAKDLLILQVVLAYFYLFGFAHVDDLCLDSERCQGTLEDFRLALQTLSDSVEVDELLEQDRMESHIIDLYLLCAVCRGKAHGIIRERREDFWKGLPQRFKIVVDGWASEVAE